MPSVTTPTCTALPPNAEKSNKTHNRHKISKLYKTAIQFKAAAVRLLMLAAALDCAYGRSAMDAFKNMPPEVFNLLPRNTRLDMVDYFEAGLSTPSRNVFGGDSRILSASPGKVDVLMGQESVLTIALVPQGRDTLVAVIETVKTPVSDSSLRLYRPRTEEWTQISTPMPGVADFLTTEGRKAGLREADFPPMFFMSVEYEPETGVFTFKNRCQEHWTSHSQGADSYRAMDYMLPELRMHWNGRKFVPLK